ncbi:MAG: UPF0058 family protein [Candidatus Aenigmarchaeota archaeon]|nr:UPF0058 family protein [Candidatus Aenigmarchaeota archaeon]
MSIYGMNKGEVLQLHILFVQVREYLQKTRELDKETIAEFFIGYDFLDVKPTDVHKSIGQHEESIYLLASSIVELMEYLDPSLLKDKPHVREPAPKPYLVPIGI